RARQGSSGLQSRPWHHAGDACRPCRADAGRDHGREAAMTTRSPASPLVRALVSIAILAVLTALLFFLGTDDFYLWAKAIHIIAVIAWMAGMLYLPRLFVYHAEVPVGSPQSETFKVMERRLLRAIINPAMTVTWVFGLWLAWKGFAFQGGWLHAKITLVLI